MDKAVPLVMLAVLLIALSACGSSATTIPPLPAPKVKPLKPRPATPPPNREEAALEETTKCLQGTPRLKVDTNGGSLADLQVSADLDIGGGNAQIAVFSSHDQAVKYSKPFNNGAVGNLAAAVFTYKGSQNFQTAVQGCLG